MPWGQAVACLLALVCSRSAVAHDLILTTGYANSGSPEVGEGISESNKPFAAGGGYAFAVRLDVRKPGAIFEFGPEFLYWNNLTGDPQPSYDASYFQAQLGGRLSLRSRTIPAFYSGLGLGYAVSQGVRKAKWIDHKETFDGDFPTGLVAAGVKMPSNANGVGLLAELSYSFGLDSPEGWHTVGPASAFLIQIGLLFDARPGRAR